MQQCGISQCKDLTMHRPILLFLLLPFLASAGVTKNQMNGFFVNNSKFIQWDAYSINYKEKSSSCTRPLDRWQKGLWRIEILVPCKVKTTDPTIKEANALFKKRFSDLLANNRRPFKDQEVKLKLVIVPNFMNFRWKKKAVFVKRIPLLLVESIGDNPDLSTKYWIGTVYHELSHAILLDNKTKGTLKPDFPEEVFSTIIGQCAKYMVGFDDIGQLALPGLYEFYQSGKPLQEYYSKIGMEEVINSQGDSSGNEPVEQYIRAAFMLWDRFGRHPKNREEVLNYCNKLAMNPNLVFDELKQ